MLNLLELYPDVIADKRLHIPESGNGLSDLLASLEQGSVSLVEAGTEQAAAPGSLAAHVHGSAAAAFSPARIRSGVIGSSVTLQTRDLDDGEHELRLCVATVDQGEGCTEAPIFVHNPTVDLDSFTLDLLGLEVTDVSVDGSPQQTLELSRTRPFNFDP